MGLRKLSNWCARLGSSMVLPLFNHHQWICTLVLSLLSAYHTKCVDRWLTSRKTCPVCKQKVVSSRSHCDHTREEADSSLNESEVSESTPLLRSMASTSTHSVSITSGGSPLEQDEDSTDIEDDVLDISQEEIVVEEELVQVQQYNLAQEWGRPDRWLKYPAAPNPLICRDLKCGRPTHS